MPIPFQSATWRKRSTIPSPTLFGAISGTVQGVLGASFHKESKVVQTFGPIAHSFTTYFGAAQASLDEGVSWFSTYLGDGSEGNDEYILNTFSLDTPSGTYHYQVRGRISHSFFIADGSLQSGGIRMYVTSFTDPDVDIDGVGGFFPCQDLYSWPTVTADPANTGGNNVISVAPSFSTPVMLPGSGPLGEDAFWAAASYQLDVGGTNNRQTLKAMDLWRSVDGFVWEKVKDLTSVSPFSLTSPTDSFGKFIKSTSGKIMLSHAGGLARAATQNLLTTAWTDSVGLATPNSGWFDPMYGGTWVTFRNGSLIAGGFIQISCDDGANFASGPSIPTPVNRNGFGLKVGPSEAIFVIAGFSSPSSETVCWYSSDGGETWAGGEVWLASTIGEQPVAAFLMADGRPLVITTQRAFTSSDTATGIPTIRTVCPLANAGLARARRLVLCGGVITPDCQED
jgi:hypothetical protein